MDLSVRRAEPADYAAIAEIYKFPAVIDGTAQLPYPSVDSWRRFLQDSGADARYQLVAEADGQVIGIADLNRGQKHLAHIGFVGIVVHPAYQGKGVASMLLRALIDVADNWMGLLKLELSVYTDNAAAVALYKKFGFEIEGTRRMMALRGGVYKDAYAMGRLRLARSA